ncbi:MAG: hypothetical protein EFT35_06325 [Methanophagales archaeon ANME-1-THS]|nr:MAG: hypothetical protein EFT35_06325 [Methanophagales archaeon ANME-1-THS]
MKPLTKVLIGITIVACVALASWYLFFNVYLSPGTEPLRFSLLNKDTAIHTVTVEIFDPANNPIFTTTYTLRPQESIQSPELAARRGEYLFNVMLDTTTTVQHQAYVAEGNFGVMVTIYSGSQIHIANLMGD